MSRAQMDLLYATCGWFSLILVGLGLGWFIFGPEAIPRLKLVLPNLMMIFVMLAVFGLLLFGSFFWKFRKGIYPSEGLIEREVFFAYVTAPIVGLAPLFLISLYIMYPPTEWLRQASWWFLHMGVAGTTLHLMAFICLSIVQWLR